MSLTLRSLKIVIFAVIVVFSATVYASAQTQYKAKRLRLPVAVKGYIGGEGQAHYVFRVRRGQRINVRISWIKEADNNASFSVSGARDFEGDDKFIKSIRKTDGGKHWTGIAAATRDYYTYVVAHPSADYTLRISVR
jgi:hypothetical protein